MKRRYRCYRCGELCASQQWAKAHCKPSRIALRTGYRKDSERHRIIRLSMPASKRKRIAKAGAKKRWKKP